MLTANSLKVKARKGLELVRKYRPVYFSKLGSASLRAWALLRSSDFTTSCCAGVTSRTRRIEIMANARLRNRMHPPVDLWTPCVALRPYRRFGAFHDGQGCFRNVVQLIAPAF